MCVHDCSKCNKHLKHSRGIDLGLTPCLKLNGIHRAYFLWGGGGGLDRSVLFVVKIMHTYYIQWNLTTVAYYGRRPGNEAVK